MVIVTVLVIMWGVVLAPGILRRFRASSSERSISSFHHSLTLLESAAPKVVAPAYRLAGDGANRISVPQLVPIAPPGTADRRPHLVLLRPPGQGGAVSMNDRYEHHGSYDDGYEDGYYDDYDRYDDGFESRPEFPVDSFTRREAALRRRTIVLSLVGAVAVTGIGGFAFSMLWMLTALSAVLLVAYVGLMAWAATRGSISMSISRGAPMVAGERHVARAVIAHHDRHGVTGHFDERYSDREDLSAGQGIDDPDEWWDRPRRAAAR
jgi:hypothetical protein